MLRPPLPYLEVPPSKVLQLVPREGLLVPLKRVRDHVPVRVHTTRLVVQGGHDFLTLELGEAVQHQAVTGSSGLGGGACTGSGSYRLEQGAMILREGRDRYVLRFIQRRRENHGRDKRRCEYNGGKSSLQKTTS